MKASINKQVQAEQDLIDIWLYTFYEWDEKQADKYIDDLDAAIKKLIDNPELGMECGYIRKGYRRLSVLHHKIYYYLKDQSVEVVRVLHEKTDENRNF